MNLPVNEHWGVLPVLFRVGGVAVPSYGVFMSLAVLTAALLYFWEARREGQPSTHGIILLLAALFGGGLGAKLAVWLFEGREILGALPDIRPLFSGRTIVGGLIGGVLTVELAKRVLGITTRTGHLFAPGLALAICIGRIGCFLGGCCYGVPTPFTGVDFGDGIPRIPTQLIESAFALCLFVYLQTVKGRLKEPGRLFIHFMLAYFTFRFGIEFLRQEPRPYLGLTLAQVVSLAIIGYYVFHKRIHRTEGVQNV
ncbi:MAG TPA: prolipoprotein diacylglyceryl transferase family protein [Armatimonadota bacterium]|jgi:phosphatidylglycerol:prolipoprotein diacylglycerol transferase